MHELAYLKDLVVILSVAVIVVIAFHRLKLPAIAGFILSGLLVGPRGLGLVSDVHQVEVLAEIGVALLLFGIGLELPLSKLRRLWKLAAVGGILQVGLSTLAAYGIGLLAGLSSNAALLIGFIVALSSTAIVLRGLQNRGEVDAPHGRLILGILVFQDFSVVPIMLIIPLLTGADVTAGAFVTLAAKSFGIVAAVVLLAILVVPRILKLVAQTRQRQLFILSVFVVCLGTAWLVTQSGASLAIGAFLAGLVVAGSEYRHQAMADMISFREIFASLFFVSVGMLLSPDAIFENLVPILAILGGILLGKSAIVFVAALITRMPLRACVIAAFALAQVGEFSFVLLYALQGTDVIDPSVENSLVSAAILSMFITPFVMSFGPRLATGLGKFSRLKRLIEVESAEEAAGAVCKLCDHVIVAGYGFAGRELAQVLEGQHIPYIIVDLNIENVRRALDQGRNAVFGDITSDEVMHQLGIDKARELVLLTNDPSASEHAIRVARELAPRLFITVRTTYLLDIEPLMAAGADEVIPAEREAAVQVAAQVLKRHRVGIQAINDQALEIRDHSEDDNA
ncbi:MAG: cation:proton antiporter [candidate division Zixibacteria bacterium]|nr:cation:proton antiporter [candidate division Zixibacteria bacterium]